MTRPLRVMIGNTVRNDVPVAGGENGAVAVKRYEPNPILSSGHHGRDERYRGGSANPPDRRIRKVIICSAPAIVEPYGARIVAFQENRLVQAIRKCMRELACISAAAGRASLIDVAVSGFSNNPDGILVEPA